MKIALRHILMLVALMISATMWGQYNPSNPPEPGATYTLTLRTTPADGGRFNISTTTSYSAGTSVRIVAYSNTNFKFIAWEENGIVIATTSQIDYMMDAENVTLTAHFEYDPSNPGEPSEPDLPTYSRIFVTCNPSDGGTVNVASGNKYQVGSSVSLQASNSSNFSFKNWTEDGEVISTSKTFNYVVKDHDSYLVANFEYNPGNPEEPGVARLMRKLTLVASPSAGGYFNISSGNSYTEGSTVDIRAYSNNFYSFLCWTEDDDTISTSYNMNYVIPTHDVTLTAHYKYNYNPSNPNEPGEPTGERHTIYGMTENGVRGETIHYPIYFENTQPVTGIYVDAQFPNGFVVDEDNVILGERTSNHTLEVISLGNNVYRFRIIGDDNLAGTNGKVLEIPVTIPDTATMGKNYAVKLSHGVMLKSDASQTPISVRSGYIYVEKLSEDGLYARFSFDKYQDRVQFRNLSSGKAVSYLWDFGDGQQSTEQNPLHVYATAGNYSVKLTAYGAVDTDIAEDLVVINDPSTWRADGNFYLADNELGARHYKSLEELLTALNRATIGGNVVINVLSGTTTEYDLSSSHMTLLQQAFDHFQEANYSLTFVKRANDRNPVILYGNSLNGVSAETISKVLSTCERFKYNGVDMRVCGIMIDAQALVNMEEQTVNSGARTSAVDFSLISPDLTFTWTLNSIPENVTGFIQSGSGMLPAMTLVNENSGNYTIEYNVDATAGNVSFYNFTYRIHIVPALVGLFNDLSPAKDAVLDNTTVELSWNQIINATYDVYLWNANNDRPSSPVVSSTTELRYISKNFCQHGNSYKWQIIAHNGFQEVVSDTMTFSINNLPNLHIYSLDCSETAAGQPVTVVWTVKNDGTGSTGNVQWVDYVWVVQDVYVGTKNNSGAPDDNSSNNARLLKQVSNVKALEPGESYENSVEITLPEHQYGDFYVLVTTDMYDVTNIQWSAIGGSVINPYEPRQDGTGYRHLYANTTAYYNRVYEAGESTTISDNFFYKQIHIDVPPLPDIQVPTITATVVPLGYITDPDIEVAYEASRPTPLTAARVAHNTALYSGKKLKVKASVANKGGKAIENGHWRSVLYLSSSNDHNNGTLVPIATTTTSNATVEPNQTIEIEFTTVLPYEWHGDTYFHVYADIDDQVYELANTVNNWGCSEKYNVLLTPGANFEPRNLSAPSQASSTSDINIKYDVKNIGSGVPYHNTWTDKVYLSKSNNGIDQNAILIETIERKGYFESPPMTDVPDGLLLIPAEDFTYHGDDYSVTKSIKVGGLSSGTYYIYVKVDANDDIYEFGGEDNNVIRSSAIQYVEPDLTAELISISADTLSTGQTVAFTWKVKNIGQADLCDVNLTDVFYATVNQDGAGAVSFGSAENTIWLAAGAEKTLRANIEIPKKEFLDGVRYVFVSTNDNQAIKESQRGNNRSLPIRKTFEYLTEPVTNPARGAAIQVSAIDVIGQLKPGNSVKVKCNAKNYGDTPVGINVGREVYLSRGSNQRTDCPITSQEGTTLDLLPGASVTLTTTVTIPTSARGGEQMLYVTLDKNNEIHSKSTSENTAYKQVTVIGNTPNIELVSVAVPDTILSSIPTELSWQVKNSGSWSSDNTETYVYLSNDDKIDVHQDTRLGTISTNQIAAGDFINQKLNVSIADKQNGRRYIIIKNSDNTCQAVALPVMVELSPTPDLQVSSIQTNEVLTAGETITIRYSVTNNGAHATRQNYWADAFYLSSSTILDKNDAIQLGSKTHSGSLQVGAKYDSEVHYTIPPTLQGNYMLFVVTDDGDAIYESDENNNQLSSSVYINGANDRPADLCISNLSAPSSIKAGENITLSYRLSNMGEFEAKGNLRDVIYLSRDTIWDFDDPMVGVVSGNINLAPGEETTRQIQGNIVNAVEGNYYVIVRTNSTKAIAERTDANNTVSTKSPSNVYFPVLTLGSQVPVNTSGYFKLQVPGGYDGKTIGVFLAHPEDATVGLYSAHEQVPSTAQYDLASQELQVSQQEVLIPDVKEGNYYLLAQDLAAIVGGEGNEFHLTNSAHSCSTNMTISAKEVFFGATTLSIPEGGTGGWLTTDVRGAMFDSIMDFRLVNDQLRIPAELTSFKGKTLSRVTFNLNDVETGLYDVETELPNGTYANLPQGFRVIPGASVGLGIKLETPGELRAGSYGPISIAYANGGTTDIEIYEILVVIDNGYLSTSIAGLQKHESVIHIKPGGETDSRGYISIPPGTQDVVSAFIQQTIGLDQWSTITVYIVK